MRVLRLVKNRVYGLLVAMVSGTCVFLLVFGSVLKLPPQPSTINFLKVPIRALHDYPVQPPVSSSSSSHGTRSTNSTQESCVGGGGRWVEGLPPLYIITPTYPRAEQLPEITRTAQTLLHVPNLVWLVSEDAATPTQSLVTYLNQSAINSVYLRAQMPAKYNDVKLKSKPRGVANRMAGLNWIRQHAKEGVFYFADDDNTYDIRLFEQMRWTKKVSMFPVGLVTKLGVSTPIVREGKVVGFYDGWIAQRKFPVDMAGFAVSVPFLLSRPNASMPFVVGYEEDGFLKSLGITSAEIEPLAFNCTKIWVWHTQTKKNDAATPVKQDSLTMGTNLDIIKGQLWKDPPGTIKDKDKDKKKKKTVIKKKS